MLWEVELVAAPPTDHTYAMAVRRVLIIVVLSVFCGALPITEGAGRAVPMKKFTVDLDKPPQERWIDLISHYTTSVPFIVDYFDQQAPKPVRDLLDKIAADLDGLLGELGEEMRAIADYWKVDLGIIVTLNFAYELRKLGGGHPNSTGSIVTPEPVRPPRGIACTSIVAQDGDGNVFHGRNLDWNLPDNIRNLTVQADFLQNGEVLFTGDVTAGFVGILTGVSRGGFSLSINERALGGDPIVDALEALLRHAFSPTHLARKILSTATTYEEAVKILKEESLTAPVYYIVAGSLPSQGAVLSRDRNFLADLWVLNVSSAVPNSWYLLETNYDHWKSVEPYDNRRYYGNMYMQTIGRDSAASMSGLYSVLSTWPLSNSYTTYTAVMHPKTCAMESYDVYS